jgi:hypothetical protein
MADTSSGGNGMMGVLVGILLVAVIVLGFYVYNGGIAQHHTLDIHVQAPNVTPPAAPSSKG